MYILLLISNYQETTKHTTNTIYIYIYIYTYTYGLTFWILSIWVFYNLGFTNLKFLKLLKILTYKTNNKCPECNGFNVGPFCCGFGIYRTLPKIHNN